MRDIGYPSPISLRYWLYEYVPDTVVKPRNVVRYTEKQRKYAVEYYINHDCNLSHTVQALGYPSVLTLSKWISRYSPVPKSKFVRKVNSSNVLSDLDANIVQDNVVSDFNFRDKQEQSDNASVIQLNTESKAVFPEDFWLSKLYDSKQKNKVKENKFMGECYDALVTIFGF